MLDLLPLPALRRHPGVQRETGALGQFVLTRSGSVGSVFSVNTF
jgi:hypothetical protein